jgi:hypothetical protein
MQEWTELRQHDEDQVITTSRKTMGLLGRKKVQTRRHEAIVCVKALV